MVHSIIANHVFVIFCFILILISTVFNFRTLGDLIVIKNPNIGKPLFVLGLICVIGLLLVQIGAGMIISSIILSWWY